jgi:hypothetical protein
MLDIKIKYSLILTMTMTMTTYIHSIYKYLCQIFIWDNEIKTKEIFELCQRLSLLLEKTDMTVDNLNLINDIIDNINEKIAIYKADMIDAEEITIITNDDIDIKTTVNNPVSVTDN